MAGTRRPEAGERERAANAPLLTSGAVALDNVRPESLRWLWPGRIPLGKLTVLDGDPGLGKSALTLDLAARVSRGAALPDGSVSDLDGPASVVLLCSEDGLGETVRPRLEAAGADLRRVIALTGMPTETWRRPVTLPQDIAAVGQVVKQVGARLVVIDPLMAYLNLRVNAYQEQIVRTALVPIALLAAASGSAVVIVRHLAKTTGTNPLYQGGGSIGILATARSGLVVGADPDDPTGARRVLAVTKGNLAGSAPALAYTLESSGASAAMRVVWHGPVEHTAATLLAARSAGAARVRGAALAEAMAFLRGLLADGPRPAQEVLAAARRAGHAENTLRRGKLMLRVMGHKDGHGGWWWALPSKQDDQDHQDDQDDQARREERLDHLRGQAPAATDGLA